VSNFSDAETIACVRLIELALQEDLGAMAGWQYADISSYATIIPADCRTVLVARNDGVLSGLPTAGLIAAALGSAFTVEPMINDGDRLFPGSRIAVLAGAQQSILAAERTVLNFLQHLSGIATLTRQYVDALAGLPCQILDTRKTTPGWRRLEKYAVRCGGGKNHRMGLYDAVLIKDNHVAASAWRFKGNIANIVATARKEARVHRPEATFVEIEVDSLEQLAQALSGKPDIVLLDNMTLDQMCEAVARRNADGPGVLLEASGGVNLQTVRAIAETGVDRISVGALTHSAPALDIGLDYENG
jgi:nicotinate-nucleotide pyrophosphorylase (carboxylating)